MQCMSSTRKNVVAIFASKQPLTNREAKPAWLRAVSGGLWMAAAQRRRMACMSWAEPVGRGHDAQLLGALEQRIYRAGDSADFFSTGGRWLYCASGRPRESEVTASLLFRLARPTLSQKETCFYSRSKTASRRRFDGNFPTKICPLSPNSNTVHLQPVGVFRTLQMTLRCTVRHWAL